MGETRKTCTRCEGEKALDEFPTDRSKKDGKASRCKDCKKEITQEKKNKNLQDPVKPGEERKVCKECNSEKLLTEFYRENTTMNGFKSKCKVCCNTYKREYNKKNRGVERNSYKTYYYERGGRETKQRYKKANRVKIQAYTRHRIKINVQAKLAASLRRRLRNALKLCKQTYSKLESAIVLVGCTLVALKEHLEKQFKEGMSWENYGKWEIDHIRPIASYDLTSIEQQKECFHYTNLQPLWAIDNRKKGCKILI
jgi:hypothetical protein